MADAMVSKGVSITRVRKIMQSVSTSAALVLLVCATRGGSDRFHVCHVERLLSADTALGIRQFKQGSAPADLGLDGTLSCKQAWQSLSHCLHSLVSA